jgi:hypothetical protein
MTRCGHAFLILVYAALLAAADSARAQSDSLQVRPADRELITQQPRQIVTLAFTVRNGTNRRIEAEPLLVLPPGWRIVTPELPFGLAAGETVVRLVSFMIPETARAGEYPVSYAIQDRLLPATRDAYAVRVNVLPEQKLQVLALESPGFVIAGENYRAAFLVRNTGNALLVAKFSIRGIYGSEPQPRAGEVTLEAGESKTLEFDVATSAVRRRADEHLTLIVEVPGAAIRSSAGSVTQVVPRIGSAQAYRTLASEVDLSLIARDADGRRTNGWQVGLSGSGVLDDEGTRHLGVRLRGPDVRDEGAFGYTDDYALSYWDATKTINVGDDIYGLSLLTDPGHFGRGARAGYDSNGLGLSVYRAKDRFTADREQTGLNLHSQATSATRMDLNLLDKRGGSLPAALRSFGSRTQWTPGLHTAFEIGHSDGDGERGRAWRGELYDSTHALRYQIFGWRAEPDYRGYLRDEEYLSAGFDYPRDRWGLHGYYRWQNRNLDEDTVRPAPQERQTNFGVERIFGKATRATLDYYVRAYADEFLRQPVDIENRSARLGLNQSFKDVSLLYSLERGRTESRIGAAPFDTTLHVLSAFWRASLVQNYGLYAMRDDNAHSKEPQGRQTTFGLHASYDFKSTQLSFDAQRNYEVNDEHDLRYDYADSHYDRRIKRRTTYNMMLRHELRNGDRVSLLARRIAGRQPQTDVLLTYTLPFDLPLFRKPNVAMVRGRIYDAEHGAGVRNVVLNLDGLTAVTNGSGEFEFPAVTAGNYRLSMDRSNVAVSKVPLSSLPLNVTVAAREAQRIDVALVRSVSISVNVRLHAGSGNGIAHVSSSQPATMRGLQNVLVTLRNGEQVYHRLTDADGQARLAGLPPGDWTASIAADAIPQGYGIASRELVLQIPPGASATAEFPLTPVTRDIKMLPPLIVVN